MESEKIVFDCRCNELKKPNLIFDVEAHARIVNLLTRYTRIPEQ